MISISLQGDSQCSHATSGEWEIIHLFNHLISSTHIPHISKHLQISGESIGERLSVTGMHERKTEMYKHADAFIALPGKKSPLDFFFRIVLMCVYFILRWVWNHGRTSGDYSMVSTWNTWKTSIVVYICFFWVSISASKVCWNWYTWQVGLLNVDGYYNSLLALFDKGVEEGFIDESERNIVVSAETVEELITKMEVDWIWFSWIKKHKNTITQFNIVSTYLLWVVF